ncbi:MAG: hypothetical protein R8J94_03785 [Acidimicrobiia bacterium]|nr:hypothetical protein [Acidimicrobiia bacterium]
MTTNYKPDAVVMTAPDGCTKYLLSAVERSLEEMDDGALLEVPCDPFSRLDIATWCLEAGRTPLNPSDEFDSLFIKNTAAAVAA